MGEDCGAEGGRRRAKGLPPRAEVRGAQIRGAHAPERAQVRASFRQVDAILKGISRVRLHVMDLQFLRPRALTRCLGGTGARVFVASPRCSEGTRARSVERKYFSIR